MADTSNFAGLTSLPKRRLGQSDLEVSTIGLGAAEIGNLYRQVTEQESKGIVSAAWDRGMRYFDTAPLYGFGLSERRLGDVLRTKPRDQFVLSTKVGRILKPVPGHQGSAKREGFCTPMPFEPDFDYSYDGVMRSFESSLQRLGIATIDVLLVHDIGELTHGEANRRHFKDFEAGGYRALEELRNAGDIKAIGLGVNECQICEDAMQIGRFDCFLLAGRYTLLEQGALDAFMPKCSTHGAGLIIGGVYNSGILATGVRHGGEVHYNYEPAPTAVIGRVRAIEEICDAHDVTLAAAALQFPLAHDLVSAVIPGIDMAQRVNQTMELAAEVIPAAFWSDLKAAELVDARAPTP